MEKTITVFLSYTSKKEKDMSKMSINDIRSTTDLRIDYKNEEDYLANKSILQDVISDNNVKQEVIIKSESIPIVDIRENRTKLSLNPISNFINGTYKRYKNYES